MAAEASKHDLFFSGGTAGVLLLHAYTGSPRDVQLLARYLHEQGYTVLAPCFCGHQQASVQHLLEQTPQQWWQDVLSGIATLRAAGCQRLAVFGLSLGGMMALKLLAAQQPDVLVGGSFNSAVPLVDSDRVAAQLHRYVVQHTSNEAADLLAQRIAAADRQLQQIEEFSLGVAEQLLKIDCPVLVVQSLQDELIDVASGAQLIQRMPFAEPQLAEFADSTHVVTVGKERMAFQQTVVRFLHETGVTPQ